VDAPRSVEVAQRVQPTVFRSSPRTDDASRDLSGTKRAIDDARAVVEAAVDVGEGEVTVPFGAGEPPFPQRVDQEWWQRDRALASRRLRRSDLAITVGALPDVENRLFEVDIRPAQTE